MAHDKQYKDSDGDWRMPEWMEPYRDVMQATHGNSVEYLYNGGGITSIAVVAQVNLLYSLHEKGVI